MPIRPPALDDRRFDDLVAELVARIPAHTPEWTHPRVGDPGRTLIDLFAWLGDAVLYRANLIPERQRLAFLQLLGQPLRPAQPARGLVTVHLKEGESPALLALRAPLKLDGPVPFEARHEMTVLPLSLAAFFKKGAMAASLPAGMEEALASLHGQGGGIKPYITTALFSEGRPEQENFDGFATPTDRCVWLGLFAAKASAPAEQESLNARVRAALAESPTGGRVLLNVGFVPGLSPGEALPMTTGRGRGAVPHVWEITVNSSGRPVDEDHAWEPEYLALDEVRDGTAGLTRPGVVRLALPRPALLHAPTSDVRADSGAGVGDRPPRLDDDALAPRLIAWIRLRPKALLAAETSGASTGSGFTSSTSPGSTASLPEPAPSNRPGASAEPAHLWVSWMGVNAMEIEQLVSRGNLIIGESDGSADQEFSLPSTSIEAATLQIEVEGEGGLETWHRVDDLAALDFDSLVARDARVFQLDAEAGTIRFGDGMRGRIPAAGSRVVVRHLRSGGGAAGNLPAETLSKITATTITGESVSSRLAVVQRLPLTGGADAEALKEAERRIPSLFRHRERAVTADDYKVLARETPGVQVGRVEVLPRFKPQQRFSDMAGIVTVLALPTAPLAAAPNPRADRPFLESIHDWLEARRPVGVELYVIGCEYVPMAVSVAISLREDAEPTTTEQAVRQALQRVLWPLPAGASQTGGGFDAQGWPLGRALSNRELAVEVARVPGVAEVGGLNLFEIDPASRAWRPCGDSRNGREQNLALARWQLPELLAVIVVQADAPPLNLAGVTANPFADPNAVAVPVVPRLC